MTKVKSSLVDSYEYNKDSRELFLVLKGRLLVVKGFSSDNLKAFRAAKSKGAFYNAEIKGKFESQPLGEYTV